MLPILCKNELTGIVTEVTEIADLSTFDQLEEALNSTAPPTGDVFRYEIAPLTYVTTRTIKYLHPNGAMVEDEVSNEYIRSTIYQIHKFLSDQIDGYISYSHDIQYFVGAIRNFSEPVTNENQQKEYGERFEKIQALSSLMHAKATYFRYLTDNIDILEKRNINVFQKIEVLSIAIEAMSDLYEKNVRTKIITNSRPILRSHDMFEFVPLAAIENAVKYGPKAGVAIAFNVVEDADDFRLEIGSLGPTISEDELPKIMNRSFRATATKRIASGHGIGLFQANIGAGKLFSGKLSFRQSGPAKIIDKVSYSNTIVSIHMPKGNISN